MSNIRIAQVLLRPQLGGAETLVSNLDAEFQSRHFATCTVYLEPDGTALGARGRLRALHSQLTEFKPTHVLSHSALPNIYARLVAPWRVPVTCVLHSASDDFADRILKTAEWALLPRTHAVVAVSQTAQDQYTRRFPIRDRVFLINNGASHDFHPSGSASATPRRFVSVARVADQKNPSVWMQAVEMSQSQFGVAQFTWWGPAGSDGYAETMASFNDTHGNGQFEGPTTEAASRMREADVFLHTADAEANSIVLLEAAASGLPIVCSEAVAGTLPEDFAVTSFRTGDAADCVSAIKQVREEWGRKRADADANAELVNQRFRMGPVVDRYLEAMGIAQGCPGPTV